jgi:hypothetical protein
MIKRFLRGGTMRRVMQWLVLGSSCIVVTVGCSDAFGIEDVLGMWEAKAMNGMAVPGTVEVYVHHGDTMTVDIQYIRLEFRDAGRGTQIQSVREEVLEFDFTYVVNLEAKTIMLDNSPGTFDGDELTIAPPNAVGPPNIVVYQRM